MDWNPRFSDDTNAIRIIISTTEFEKSDLFLFNH